MRPPARAPVSDLFATALHRYGAAWADLMVASLAALALASVPVWLASRASEGATAPFRTGVLCYSVAYFGLVAYVVLHGLAAPAPRARVASAYAVALVTGLVAGASIIALFTLAVAVLPLLLYVVPAAAAGDAAALQAVPFGMRLAVRNFVHTLAAWLLALFFCAGVLVGFYLLTLPFLSDGAQLLVSFALAVPIIWPVSALLVRAVYGDLTGRLVVAPEDRTR
jgi:hypothetical protein